MYQRLLLEKQEKPEKVTSAMHCNLKAALRHASPLL